MNRLLNYLLRITPHRVKYTLTLNGARRMLLSLTTPLAKISAKLEKDTIALREKYKELAQTKSKRYADIYVPETIIHVITLNKPRMI